MSDHSIAEILDKAADLLTPEGAWTQGGYARDMHNSVLADGRSPFAECWCAVGALEKVSGGLVGRDLADPIYVVLGLSHHASIVDWNDAPTTTQAEVVATLRSAATLARETEARS